MSQLLQRTVRRGPAARHELTGLLQGLWLAELLRPSAWLLLAAPTLADAVALDNSAGGFSDLEPNWGQRPVSLSELLTRNLLRAGRVAVFSGPDSEAFLRRLEGRAVDAAVRDRLVIRRVTALPTVGLVGDEYHLAGALTWTDAGPDLVEEGVVLTVGEQASQRGSELFTAAYGGLNG